MNDLDFLNVNINDAQELSTLPDGTEATVEVISADAKPEKFYVRLRMKVISHDFVQSFSHFVFYPKPDDDAEQRNKRLLNLKHLYTALGITEQVKDPTDFIGRTAMAILKLEDGDDQYGPSNAIRKFSTGR